MHRPVWFCTRTDHHYFVVNFPNSDTFDGDARDSICFGKKDICPACAGLAQVWLQFVVNRVV